MKKYKNYIVLIIVFLLGVWIGNSLAEPKSEESSEVSQNTQWTCSMHPNVKLPDPGQCPICFMDLIPLEENMGNTAEPVLSLSKTAEQLADISTIKVVKREAHAQVRVTGKLQIDETRLKEIASWMDGRIERLYVDFTGTTVRENDHLLELYSPPLIAAQEEILSALQNNSQPVIEAAREKLRLLGLSPTQIGEIESKRKLKESLTIHTPISGVVLKKHAQEGEYVKKGQHLFSVADLSGLWLILDVFESDIAYLYLGQEVEFETTSFPGRVFTGTIAFIDPVLDPATRTVKVRVNIPNEDLSLKPEMLAAAIVSAKIDAEGKTIHTVLKGKFVCPMHHYDVHLQPGICSICEMEIVKAESIPGLVSGESTGDPLLIPKTAVLRTGERTVVYVRSRKNDEVVFEGREIVLGPKAGDEYVVIEGLEEGEEVVINGAFKIDSALQIEAKPSMMSPRDADEALVEEKEVFALDHDQYEAVLPLYLELQDALAADDLTSAKFFMNNIIMAKVFQFDHMGKDSIEDIRVAFELISLSMVKGAENHHHGSELHEVYCPMAFNNKGASWLQSSTKVANPYFGSKMLRCGVVTNSFGVHHGK